MSAPHLAVRFRRALPNTTFQPRPLQEIPLNALLDLIESEHDARTALAICAARGLTITHRSHRIPLDEKIIRIGDFTTNFGGYGSRSGLGLGRHFSARQLQAAICTRKGIPLPDHLAQGAGVLGD